MPGLYIHIPFCKQACHYCNFHFSTQQKGIPDLVAALIHEIELRHQEIREPLASIYLGGGTPSLLTPALMNQLFDGIHRYFAVSDQAEITLEANPDDLEAEKLNSWKSIGINRLSVGIQSFYDDDLHQLNRAHDATMAIEALEKARKAGFRDFSIDLIYGIPGLTLEKWKSNLQRVIDLGVEHVSAYCLTVEPRTALDHLIRKGSYPRPDEEEAEVHFRELTGFLGSHGFEQYEISNFARNKRYAVHNTAYWKGEPYLGIGPSAHSYDGKNRSWNIANNAQYLRQIKADMLPGEIEQLTPENRFNEQVMTGLRTMWGIDLTQLAGAFPDLYPGIRKAIEGKIKLGLLKEENGHLKLTDQGKFLADGIASDLFA